MGISNRGRPSHRTFTAKYQEIVSYEDALRQQETLRCLRTEGKVPDTVMVLQHPHVYTVGRFSGEENIIVPPGNVPVYHTSRGGSITYHGPGQLVGYPIIDLRANGLGVRRYILNLEETIIRLLLEFGIRARRHDRYSGGVWVNDRKICSIGINVSRHITMHGFALNVNTDLKYFEYIRPCGIQGAVMTSMANILGYPLPFDEVVDNWVQLFSETFEMRKETEAVHPIMGVAGV